MHLDVDLLEGGLRTEGTFELGILAALEPNVDLKEGTTTVARNPVLRIYVLLRTMFVEEKLSNCMVFQKM